MPKRYEPQRAPKYDHQALSEAMGIIPFAVPPGTIHLHVPNIPEGTRMPKTFSFGELLTDKEAKKAVELRNIARTGDLNLNGLLVEHIFTPTKMAEINAKLGQENDASYMAYALEYALGKAGEV